MSQSCVYEDKASARNLGFREPACNQAHRNARRVSSRNCHASFIRCCGPPLWSIHRNNRKIFAIGSSSLRTLGPIARCGPVMVRLRRGTMLRRLFCCLWTGVMVSVWPACNAPSYTQHRNWSTHPPGSLVVIRSYLVSRNFRFNQVSGPRYGFLVIGGSQRGAGKILRAETSERTLVQIATVPRAMFNDVIDPNIEGEEVRRGGGKTHRVYFRAVLIKSEDSDRHRTSDSVDLFHKTPRFGLEKAI
jgi:hypothetical protein